MHSFNMILETVCVGPMQVNCYILAAAEGQQAIVIDPGDEEQKIRRVLAQFRLKPAMVVNTHGHIDHIGCDDKFDTPIYIHRQDLPLLKDPKLNLSSLLLSSFTPLEISKLQGKKTRFLTGFSVKSKIYALEDKQDIELKELRLETIHVPGHTPGGIALLMHNPENNILFTGDSLFCQGIGRTDFPGADETLLIKSIKKKLLTLSEDTVIYPGHGPTSTIGEEKRNNPFLS